MRIPARVSCSLPLLLLWLPTACGDDGGASPDGRAGDAAGAADAVRADAGPDATPGPMPVTVRAHDGGAGLPGLQVAFLGPDDAVITVTTTDGSGEASAVVPFGGQAVLVSADRRSVYLWQGLNGGSIEVFFDRYDSMTVLVPAGPDTTGYYEVQTPCGGGGGGSPSVSLSFLRRGCTSSDVVAVWRSGQQPARSFHVSGQALVGGTTLDLSAQTYRPHVTRGMVFTGVSAAEQTLIDIDLMMPGPVIVGGPGNNVGTAAGEVMISGALADLPGGLLRSTIGQIRAGVAHQVSHVGPVTETSFAPGPHWLPDAGPANLDAATRAIRWTQGAGGQRPDGFEVYLAIDLPGVTPPTGTTDVFWNITSPGQLPDGAGEAQVHLPVLPAELVALDPASGTQVGFVHVNGYAVPGGYPHLRDHVFGRYGWNLLDGAGTMAKVNNRGNL